MNNIEEITKYFPIRIAELILDKCNKNIKEAVINKIEEVRIRIGKPVILKLREEEMILEYNVSQNEIFRNIRKDM